MKHTGNNYSLLRQEGFTLIEVLIVIAIFSIGILGAMSMQISAINTNATTRKSTLAMEYATDTMERLMQVGYSTNDKFNFDDNGDGSTDELAESDLRNDGEDNDGDGSTDEADELEWHRLPEFQAGAGYTRGTSIIEDAYYDSVFDLTWDITDIDCDGDSIDDAKRIDIFVSWNNGSRTIRLTNIRTSLM